MKPGDEVIGLIAGILTSGALIPQLVKTVREHSAEDVSPLMFIVLLCGNSLWAYYGILRDDLPIIVTNSFSVLLNTVMLFLKLRFKGKS